MLKYDPLIGGNYMELVFEKNESEYDIKIKDMGRTNDTISMKLDTGSPITIICIPYLLEITKESYSTLLLKIENAKNSGNVKPFYP